jgi:hypothetical protein
MILAQFIGCIHLIQNNLTALYVSFWPSKSDTFFESIEYTFFLNKYDVKRFRHAERTVQ